MNKLFKANKLMAPPGNIKCITLVSKMYFSTSRFSIAEFFVILREHFSYIPNMNKKCKNLTASMSPMHRLNPLPDQQYQSCCQYFGTGASALKTGQICDRR